MKSRTSQNRNDSAKRISRKSLFGVVVAMTVLVIGVVTVVSMPGKQRQEAKVEERKPQVAKETRRNYVTLNAAGQAVSNQAFVLMEYFGYLRRDPNNGPDADFTGYNFWLNKLNAFGNFQDAEMVKAFLVSGEYRGRFVR